MKESLCSTHLSSLVWISNLSISRDVYKGFAFLELFIPSLRFEMSMNNKKIDKYEHGQSHSPYFSVQLRRVPAVEIQKFYEKQESISVPHRRLGVHLGIVQKDQGKYFQ